MRFAILGALAVANSQRPVSITAARERAILAMLLLNPNRTVTTGRLIQAVWEDRPPVGALSQLHACVSRLRRSFAQGGLPRSLIATAPAGYAIAVTDDQLDSLEFARLVDLAREAMAKDQREAARAHYRQALNLWRGPALDGVDGATIRRLAAPLDEQRLQVQQECLTLELDLGLSAETLPELTELATRHPYHEPLHRLLMLALYRAGRQADATAAYRQFERSLREEVGTEASAQLQRLHQAILRGDPNLERSQAAPAGPAARVPQELPMQVSGFTGRAAALAGLTDALRDDAAGPVTVLVITGSPGVGKTALAVYWAHRIADRFPDGQLFVSLRGNHPGGALRPVQALAALLRSLGVPADDIPDDEGQAAALFRSLLARGRALVVLDDAGSAEQVRPLLPGSGGNAVLVTSRDRLSGLLAQDGARRFPLDVLAPAEAEELLRRLLGQDRLAAEPDAAAALADACARLPLALRIAAAHLADRPSTSIAGYLTDLRSGDRLAALQIDGDQSSSVSDALGLSYHALPPDAARLLRRLGLVPGPDVTPAAAAALVDATPDDATRLLARLVRSSLLTETARGRYVLHDLLREFATRLAETEDPPHERESARERLLRFYLARAEAAAAEAYGHMLRLPMPASETHRTPSGFADRDTALAWLDAERSNLVAAVTDAAQRGPRRYAWLLADRLRGYFWYSRQLDDWLSVGGAALAGARYEPDARVEVAARLSLGDAYVISDRYEEAVAHYRRAADLARDAGWTAGETAALNNLGMPYIALGRLAETAELYQRALALDPGGTHATARSRQLQNLASAEAELGRLDDAYAHFTEALALHRDAGNRSGDFAALAELALLHCARGQVPEALELASAAIRFAAETGNPHDQLLAANALGVATRDNGQPDQAIVLHRQAYQTAVRANDLSRQAEALRYLADAQSYAGDLEPARDTAAEALGLLRTAGAILLEGPTLTTLSEICYRQRRYELAEQHARAALARLRETGQRLGEARTLAVLGLVCHDTGRIREAERYQRLAADRYTEIGAVFPDRLRTP